MRRTFDRKEYNRREREEIKRINIWSKDISKIDNVFEIILKALKTPEQLPNGIKRNLFKLKNVGDVKVLLFANNKEYFDKLDIPKEMLFGKTFYTEADEKVFDYIVERLQGSGELISRMPRTTPPDQIIDIEEEFINIYRSRTFDIYNLNGEKRTYLFILVEDISKLKSARTIQLLRSLYLERCYNNIVCCLGSIIDNNIEFLSEFAASRVMLVDKLNDVEESDWRDINYFGLGDISLLKTMKDERFLCIKGNLFDQGRWYGQKPYTIKLSDLEK